MSNLDALFLAAGLLSANHTVVDMILNSALYYGPGLILAVAVRTGWRATQAVLGGFHQWADERADRRYHTARAERLHQIAGRADAYLAMPRDLVNARLEAHYAAPDHAPKEG